MWLPSAPIWRWENASLAPLGGAIERREETRVEVAMTRDVAPFAGRHIGRGVLVVVLGRNRTHGRCGDAAAG